MYFFLTLNNLKVPCYRKFLSLVFNHSLIVTHAMSSLFVLNFLRDLQQFLSGKGITCMLSLFLLTF